jgi:hypothetical protein
MSSMFLYIFLAGIAVWVPGLNSIRGSWYGFRFCIAVFSVPVYLFFGNVLLGIPITFLAWTFAAVALAGFGFQIFKRTITLKNGWAVVLHPVFVFPLLALAVAIPLGDISYLPYPGDEVSGWLRLARQVFLADAYWSNKVVYHHGAYTNGWPLMIAFSNVFDGHFIERNSIVFMFFIHVGVLGFTFDLTRFVAARSGFDQARQVWLFAWITVLGLLAAEASWVLFPTLQLIDKPLLYANLTGFLLALAGQYDDFGKNRLAAFLGFVFAAGYLLKITFILFAPLLGIIWLGFYWRTYVEQYQEPPGAGIFSLALIKKGAGWAALMLIPMMITAMTWNHFRIGTECNAAPWEIFTNPKNLTFDYSIGAFKIIIHDIFAYSGQYKLPLTLAGGAVLAAGLVWKRVRWFVVMIAAFVVFFLIATQLLVYGNCFQSYGEAGGMDSIQRYFRPNLRIVHFFGIIVAAYFLLEKFGKSTLVVNLLKNNWAAGAMAAVVVLLLGLQAQQVNQSLVDIGTRQFQDTYIRSAILDMKQESQNLLRHIQARRLDNPRVSLIAQGMYTVEWTLALYFGIKSRREGSYFYYTPEKPYSWGETEIKAFMLKTTPDDLISWWKGFDILWPVKTDAWIRTVLPRLVNNPSCIENPEKYFLFNAGNGTFTCVPK